MPRRLKLGLVGAGPVVERYHLPAIRGVPEILPWIVSDVDSKRAGSIAKKGSFRHTTNDYQELIGQVDLAVVAVPNALHAPISCRLLDAGVHVLCEKPLARTVAECQTMLDAAARGGALLATGHNRRFRSNVREVKMLLDRDIIGTIVRVEAEEGSRSDWPRSPAYFDPAIAGGGALLDVGIHSIDLIRYLVGDFVAVEYQGNGSSTEVESEGSLRFTLANNVSGVLLCSRLRRLRNELRLIGTKGALAMGVWKDSIRLSKNCGKAFRSFRELPLFHARRAADGSFVEQLFDLVDAIRSGRQPKSNGVDGFRAVEVVEWAYKGARPCDAVSALPCGA